MPIFGGVAEMNNSNKSVWELHVMKVDKLIGQILPICIIASIASILSVRDLAGLGNAWSVLDGDIYLTPQPAAWTAMVAYNN